MFISAYRTNQGLGIGVVEAPHDRGGSGLDTSSASSYAPIGTGHSQSVSPTVSPRLAPETSTLRGERVVPSEVSSDLSISECGSYIKFNEKVLVRCSFWPPNKIYVSLSNENPGGFTVTAMIDKDGRPTTERLRPDISISIQPGSYVELSSPDGTFNFLVEIEPLTTKPIFTFLRKRDTEAVREAYNERVELLASARPIEFFNLTEMAIGQKACVGLAFNHCTPPNVTLIGLSQRGLANHQITVSRDRDGFKICSAPTAQSWVRFPGSRWQKLGEDSMSISFYDTTPEGVPQYCRYRFEDLPVRVSRSGQMNYIFYAHEQNQIPMVSVEYGDEVTIHGTPFFQVYGTRDAPKIIFMKRYTDQKLQAWDVSTEDEVVIQPGDRSLRPGSLVAVSPEGNIDNVYLFVVEADPATHLLRFRPAQNTDLPHRFQSSARTTYDLGQNTTIAPVRTNLGIKPRDDSDHRAPQAIQPTRRKPVFVEPDYPNDIAIPDSKEPHWFVRGALWLPQKIVQFFRILLERF